MKRLFDGMKIEVIHVAFVDLLFRLEFLSISIITQMYVRNSLTDNIILNC